MGDLIKTMLTTYVKWKPERIRPLSYYDTSFATHNKSFSKLIRQAHNSVTTDVTVKRTCWEPVLASRGRFQSSGEPIRVHRATVEYSI